MKILDLDYFIAEIASTPFYGEERLDEECYGGMVWTEKKVCQFLEQNLELSKDKKYLERL